MRQNAAARRASCIIQASEKVGEGGISALVADGLAVRDVVADVAKRVRLGAEATDRGIHGGKK
jgi:hypothetical protein